MLYIYHRVYNDLILQKVNDILVEILKGDKLAERALYDMFKRRWYMLAQRYARTTHDANDIMQEGLIQIYTDLHQYDARKSQFSTWSSRVIVNTALRYLKKNNWHNTLLEVEKSDVINSEQDDIYSDLAAQELVYMIQQLPLGYRIVFNMNVIEGYTHKEISKKLNIAEGTSKSQLSKAKRMLRNQLENQLKAHSNG